MLQILNKKHMKKLFKTKLGLMSILALLMLILTKFTFDTKVDLFIIICLILDVIVFSITSMLIIKKYSMDRQLLIAVKALLASLIIAVMILLYVSPVLFETHSIYKLIALIVGIAFTFLMIVLRERRNTSSNNY